MEMHPLQEGSTPRRGAGVASAHVPPSGSTYRHANVKESHASTPAAYPQAPVQAGNEVDGVLCMGWGACTLFFLAILAVLGIWFRRSRATAEGVGELTADKQE